MLVLTLAQNLLVRSPMSEVHNNKKNREYTAQKILVIDDDKLIRWSLKEILSQEGYDVDTIGTASEAIDLAKNIPYQLIFADLNIQEDSGIEMVKKIKTFRPDVVTVILSAHPKQKIQPEFGDLNVFSIIEKPFKSEQLLSIAKEALDSAPHHPVDKPDDRNGKQHPDLERLFQHIKNSKRRLR